jgi:aldehyde dehydrogenase
MSAVNETLIRDVVAEVLGRIGGGATTTTSRPAPSPSAPTPAAKSDSCGCSAKKASSAAPALRGKFGVFADANEACAAAHESFLLLKQKGVEARRKIEVIIKTMAEKNAEAWGKLELDETKIGRLDHKIEKLKIIKLVPGVDWLRPDGRSGDHGITLEEFTPRGAGVLPVCEGDRTLEIVGSVDPGRALDTADRRGDPCRD